MIQPSCQRPLDTIPASLFGHSTRALLFGHTTTWRWLALQDFDLTVEPVRIEDPRTPDMVRRAQRPPAVFCARRTCWPAAHW